MLCNLVWKFIVWLSWNLLQISLLPAFISTLIYEEAFWQLGEPLWQLHLSDFHGKFCKGTHVLFPIFPSSSCTLRKGEGKSQQHGEIWNCGCFREQCEFCKTFFTYKTFSFLKRVLRAFKHPPKSCYFLGPGVQGPGIFHLLPEKFPGSLKTTTMIKDSFLWSTEASQQPFQDRSMAFSLGHILFVNLFPMLPF